MLTQSHWQLCPRKGRQAEASWCPLADLGEGVQMRPWWDQLGSHRCSQVLAHFAQGNSMKASQRRQQGLAILVPLGVCMNKTGELDGASIFALFDSDTNFWDSSEASLSRPIYDSGPSPALQAGVPSSPPCTDTRAGQALTPTSSYQTSDRHGWKMPSSPGPSSASFPSLTSTLSIRPSTCNSLLSVRSQLRAFSGRGAHRVLLSP